MKAAAWRRRNHRASGFAWRQHRANVLSSGLTSLTLPAPASQPRSPLTSVTSVAEKNIGAGVRELFPCGVDFEYEWARWDSNPGPADYESAALTRLSYGPTRRLRS
jgi:hypothetical protein